MFNENLTSSVGDDYMRMYDLLSKTNRNKLNTDMFFFFFLIIRLQNVSFHDLLHLLHYQSIYYIRRISIPPPPP